MNKQRTYQIINNLIGDSLYPYKQFEYDLQSSYDLIKDNFNSINTEYSVSNYRNSLENISKYEKQEPSITDTLMEFIQTYFDGANVNIRHQKDDIIWLLNQVKEIPDILTYVKNGEGYNYKTIAFIVILGVSEFIIDKFLNKKTHDIHSAIYKDWLKVHTYNRYVRYKNNKYTYQNSCLKHDEGYTIYSDNSIYTIKTFIINYLCDKYDVDKMNNSELAFLSDIIWMKIGKNIVDINQALSITDQIITSKDPRLILLSILNNDYF